MTKEYKLYLKKKKINKYLIYLFQIIILLAFLILWQILTDTKLLDIFILSSPKKILETTINLYNSNNIFIHILTTLKETIISFVLSMVISISLASTLWYFKNIYKVIEPYLTIINSLPKVALGPIILIWFGANEKSIIIMGILISSIVLTLNIYNGFINTDKYKEKLIGTFTKSRFKLFYYLIFPANINTIISNLKICISMSLIGLLPPVGEKVIII